MDDQLFAPKAPVKDEMPVNAWAIAGVVVLAVLAAILVFGRHKPVAAPTGIQPLDSYAANLMLSQVAMSESTSLSGGKSTFIDGHIRNAGQSTVSGVTIQVLFKNDEQLPPQIEVVPLSLIRTRQPYIDTQTVAAAPLKPGDEQEFRLTFETIPSNWNTQVPELRIIHVDAK